MSTVIRWYTSGKCASYTQLVEMGARWYSPRLGRWISPDPIIPGFANSQSFNRYMYVFGNVLKLIDPSGYDPRLELNGREWTLEEILEENTRWRNDPSNMADRENRKPFIRNAIETYHGKAPPILLLAMVAMESNGTYSNAESDLDGEVHGAMGVPPKINGEPNEYYHGPYVNTPASLEQNIKDGCGIYNKWKIDMAHNAYMKIYEAVTAAGYGEYADQVAAAQAYTGYTNDIHKRAYLEALSKSIDGTISDQTKSLPLHFGIEPDPSLVKALLAGHAAYISWVCFI